MCYICRYCYETRHPDKISFTLRDRSSSEGAILSTNVNDYGRVILGGGTVPLLNDGENTEMASCFTGLIDDSGAVMGYGRIYKFVYNGPAGAVGMVRMTKKVSSLEEYDGAYISVLNPDGTVASELICGEGNAMRNAPTSLTFWSNATPGQVFYIVAGGMSSFPFEIAFI